MVLTLLFKPPRGLNKSGADHLYIKPAVNSGMWWDEGESHGPGRDGLAQGCCTVSSPPTSSPHKFAEIAEAWQGGENKKEAEKSLGCTRIAGVL